MLLLHHHHHNNNNASYILLYTKCCEDYLNKSILIFLVIIIELTFELLYRMANFLIDSEFSVCVWYKVRKCWRARSVNFWKWKCKSEGWCIKLSVLRIWENEDEGHVITYLEYRTSNLKCFLSYLPCIRMLI